MVAGTERMQKLSHSTTGHRSTSVLELKSGSTAALPPRTWRAWQEITVKWGICQLVNAPANVNNWMLFRRKHINISNGVFVELGMC
jgi:hypothetical protein